MDRAFKSGASATPPPVPGSFSVGYPTAGDPSTAVPATKPGAWWYHATTEELLNVITAAGITLDATSTTQLRDALMELFASRADLASTASASKGAGMVGYFLGASGSYPWDVMSWMQRKVSVLDFVPPANRAAARAGTFDCAAAITAAMLACLPATPTFSFGGVDYYLANAEVEFDPGQYLVKSTPTLTGYGATKKAVGLSIKAPKLVPVYAGGNTALNPATATIIADSGSTWTADQPVLNLQYGQYCSIEGLAVKGIYGSTRGIDVSNGVGWRIDCVSVYQHKYGIYNNLSSGARYRMPGATNCSHAGIYLKDSGDSDIECPNLNTCNQDYATDANRGLGIYIATSNNSNVRGGKIEYCSIGVHLNNSQGCNVTGINFDCNGQCHILEAYDSVSGLTPNALQLKSNTIVGNRFLAGGHLAGALVKAHILIYGNLGPVNTVIVGNSFRKGSGLAYDENSGGAQPVGPGVACIHIDHQGDSTYDVGVACSGNDFWNGSVVNTFSVNAPNGANVRIKGENLTNLPNSVTGPNVIIGEPKTIAIMSSATYSVAMAERDLIANRAGTVTVTLPAPGSYLGRRLGLRTVQAQAVVSDASNVVPRPDLAAGTAILPATDGAWAEMVSDGTYWQIVASN